MDLTDPPIDFLALATSMGLPSTRITRPQDIAPGIESAIASGRPNLIEIVIGVE
jgi:benzoylformate decarboxylase